MKQNIKRTKTDWRGSYYAIKVRYENLIELKSDWENKLSVWLKEVVDNLKILL